MKLTIYYLAAVLTVLTLVACGNKKEVEPIEPPLPEPPPEPKIINLQEKSLEEILEIVQGKWELYASNYSLDCDREKGTCIDSLNIYSYQGIHYCTFNKENIVIERKDGSRTVYDFKNAPIVCVIGPCPIHTIRVYFDNLNGERDSFDCSFVEIRQDTLIVGTVIWNYSPPDQYLVHRLIKTN